MDMRDILESGLEVVGDLMRDGVMIATFLVDLSGVLDDNLYSFFIMQGCDELNATDVPPKWASALMHTLASSGDIPYRCPHRHR